MKFKVKFKVKFNLLRKVQFLPAKDSQRVNEFLRQNIVSAETMKDPIQRFGLVEKWQKFQILYPEHDTEI